MKKLYIILGVLALFVFVASPASALFNNHSTTNNYDVDVTNQGGAGGAGGAATIEKGAIKNKNVNKNKNTNVNLNCNSNKNVNKNTNKQGQIQGQMQGQMQGQGQGQDQGQDQGQMNDWTQTFEDKRDHITGPNVLQSDAKLKSGRTFRTKVHGVKMLSNIKGLTVKQAKKLSSKASDITCEEALYMENDFSTNKVKISYKAEPLPGEKMGYLYMGSDGPDVNSAAMIGEAAEQAMKAGATHMKLVEFEAGEVAEGSAWNVGLGGGASVIKGASGQLAIAPNGGLGYGKAKAFNELRPEMVFELSFDNELTSNYKLSKADYGWSASLIEDNQVR